MAVATCQASITSMATPAPNKCTGNFDKPVNTVMRRLHAENRHQCTPTPRLPPPHTHTMKNHQRSVVIKDHVCCLLLLRYNMSCSPPGSPPTPPAPYVVTNEMRSLSIICFGVKKKEQEDQIDKTGLSAVTQQRRDDAAAS